MYNFIVTYAHAAACYLIFWHAVYFVCVVLCLVHPFVNKDELLLLCNDLLLQTIK